MTKDEFKKIVNSVAESEQSRLVEVLQKAKQNSDPLASIIAEISCEISVTAARTCAQILEQASLIRFDD